MEEENINPTSAVVEVDGGADEPYDYEFFGCTAVERDDDYVVVAYNNGARKCAFLSARIITVSAPTDAFEAF